VPIFNTVPAMLVRSLIYLILENVEEIPPITMAADFFLGIGCIPH
jgi:hypothetical protein